MSKEIYDIVRVYFEDVPSKTIREGLSLKEAQEHCSDKETASKTCTGFDAVSHTEKYGPWFDSFVYAGEVDD